MRALQDEEKGYGKDDVAFETGAMERLIDLSHGDGRYALNLLEIVVLSTPQDADGRILITTQDLADASMTNNQAYDRDGNNHYDTISAFIKSIRGSDPDAAIYYMAKMLDRGEEPEYIARRMIISASEDISNADPHALNLAVACFEALRIIGMPEGRIPLAQTAAYLASAPKSNRSYLAIGEAMSDVKKGVGSVIPPYLRDQHQPMDAHEGYRYPHDYPSGYVPQRYLPLDMNEKTYYRPTDRGYEKKLAAYLREIKQEDTSGNS